MKAEMAVLGAFLTDSRLALDTCLQQEFFESQLHGQLFALIQREAAQNQIVDVVTLSVSGDIQLFGGVAYINDLIAHANVERLGSYEEVIVREWQKRALQAVCCKAAEEGWLPEQLMAEAARIQEASVQRAVAVSDVAAPLADWPFQEAEKQAAALTGVRELDNALNGFQDGELVVIGARPSMGKTDVMLNFARGAAASGYVPILFSIEMTSEALTKRLIAQAGSINRSKLRDPYRLFSDKQKKNWPHVLRSVGENSMYIVDRSLLTVADMRGAVRRLMVEFPGQKPAVFIDYLGLITPPHLFDGNANAQIAAVSRALKALAKDFHCPVVCLAQLNRSVEARQNKRPLLSDIRDSGSVEQDADVVMFLYRDAYYSRDESDKRMELIIAKNRNGQTGVVPAIYFKETGVLTDGNSAQLV